MNSPPSKLEALIQVFAKTPLSGQVKSRLARTVGEVYATRVASQLIDSLLAKLADNAQWPVEVWCSPESDHGYWLELRHRYPINLHEQCQGDLGRRMQQALQQGLQRAQKVILVGTDCPALNHDRIDRALQALNADVQVVLQPADDGGYVLIGVSGQAPDCLFNDIPWGTQRVLDDTQQCLRRKNISYKLLETLRDVDDYQDYLYYVRAGQLPLY
jgi:rSAM/selenodomain-associated transferase 1